MRNADKSTCASEEEKKAYVPPKSIADGLLCTSLETGLCSSHCMNSYCFWGKARDRNKRRTQKSQSVVHLGKNVLEVWELIIVITLQVLNCVQTECVRTVLTVFPVTCKAEKCLANSDCSAKKSEALQTTIWAVFINVLESNVNFLNSRIKH